MQNSRHYFGDGLRLLLAAVLATVMATSVHAQGPGNAGATPPGTPAASADWVEGRVLVQPRAGVSEQRLQRILEAQGSRGAERIRGLEVRVVNVPPQAEDAVIRALSRNPAIKFAEKDYLVPLSETPDDPRFDDAWHHPMIDTPSAWRISKGDNTIVAVLDTGIDSEHPDLQGQLVAGWNSVDGSQDIDDIHGHGTRVAGTLGAATDNGIGVASVGWNTRIMPIRVTNRSDGVASSSDIARALTWAADNGAHIASMSYQSWRHSTVASAAKYMRDRGGVVFGAAGNNGTDTGNSSTPYVVVVAATTSSDNTASWSNYGEYVDLSAPGASIQTTSRGGGYSSVSGTSYSTPVAAAVAALIREADPQLTPGQIEQILYDTAADLGDPGWDPHFGWGRVDAGQAVTLASSTSSGDFEPPEVAIASPADGATVHGEVVVTVDASDNVGVARVDLYADGRKVGSENVAPYEFLWNTDDELEGPIRLLAEAFDEAGNQAAHSIDVTVERPQEEEDDKSPPMPPSLHVEITQQ